MRNILYIIIYCLIFHIHVAPAQTSTQSSEPDTALATYFYRRGVHFSNNANQDSSIIFFEKAGKLYQAFASQQNDSTSWENYIRSLNALCYNYRVKGQYEKALGFARNALDKGLSLFGENNRVVAYSYDQIGLIYGRNGQYKEAIDMFDRSLAIKKKVLGENHFKVADTYRYMAIVNEQTDNFNRAIEYFQNAIDINRTNFGENHISVIRLYKDLGVVNRKIGHYEKAFEYLNKYKIKAGELLGDQHPDVANAHVAMGILYRIKGDYDEALQCYNKALPIFIQHYGENNSRVGNTYNNMGVISGYKGDHEKALEYYQKALSIEREIVGESHWKIAGLYYNIGNVYQDMKDPDRALQYHKKALDLRLTLLGRDHHHVAASYNVLGTLFREKGDIDRALDYHNKAAAIYLKIFGKSHNHIGDTYSYIGSCYQTQGSYSMADKYYTKALNIYRNNMGDKHPDVSWIYTSLGKLALEQNHIDDALTLAQKAIIASILDFNINDWYVNPDIVNIISEHSLLKALKIKADALEKRYLDMSHDIRDLKTALSTYRLISDLIDQIRNQYQYESSKLLLNEETQEIYEKAVNAALRLYGVTGEFSYKDMAFDLTEKAKSNVLLTSLRDSRARHFSGIPADLLDREKKLRIDLTFYETQIQNELQKKEGQDSLKIKAYKDLRFGLNREYQNLIQAFENEYPKYYDLKYRTGTISITELKKDLNNSAVIEYFLGTDEIFIFTITQNETSIQKIPIGDHFEDLTELLIRSIKKLNRNEFYTSSYDLYRLLIDPVRIKLAGCKKLIIIPHGILYKIPFETLISGIPAEGSADYLINHFDIGYHYSATLYSTTLKGINNIDKRHQQAFCGFAPVFSDLTENEMAAQINRSDAILEGSDSTIRSLLLDGKRMRELSYSENEVKQIVELFRRNKQSATGYYHQEASEEIFKKTIGQYKNVHIATHSIMNESNPRLSAIIFSQNLGNSQEDGVLYSGETYNLNLNADLIVLSSCESGMGKLVKGEGLMALTRGFLYSGADNLVVSLWKVSDKHTSELMIAFYENIINGDDYGTSLRKAKLRMLNNEKTAFPKSWAGFILIGK